MRKPEKASRITVACRAQVCDWEYFPLPAAPGVQGLLRANSTPHGKGHCAAIAAQSVKAASMGISVDTAQPIRPSIPGHLNPTTKVIYDLS